MKEIDFNELLRNSLASNGFVEILAHQIAMQYGEKLMDDFGNQITESLGKYVEKTIKDYMEDYGVRDRIKQRVNETYRSISKEELLDALRKRRNFQG